MENIHTLDIGKKLNIMHPYQLQQQQATVFSGTAQKKNNRKLTAQHQTAKLATSYILEHLAAKEPVCFSKVFGIDRNRAKSIIILDFCEVARNSE